MTQLPHCTRAGASAEHYIILQLNFYDGPPAAILECVNKRYLDLNAPAILLLQIAVCNCTKTL